MTASTAYRCEGCGVPVVWVTPSTAAMSCMCVVCLWCNEHIDFSEIMEARRDCEPGGWTPEPRHPSANALLVRRHIVCNGTHMTLGQIADITGLTVAQVARALDELKAP